MDIYTMRADGTDLRRITRADRDEANRQPAWSPNGTMIAYSGWGPFGNDHEIMVIGAAGGAARRLTNNEGDDLEPTWGAEADASARASVARSGPLSGRRRKLPGLRTWLRSPQAGNGSQCLANPGPFAWEPGPLLTFHSHQSILEVLHGGRLEVGTRGFVCAYGFSRARSAPPLRMLLRHPDGTLTGLKEQRSPFEPGVIAYWVARPGDQGRYRVIARQGGRMATARFDVVPAEDPHMLVLDEQHDSQVVQRIGRRVMILVAGLPPRARFALDLYRGAGKGTARGPRYFNSVDLRANPAGVRLYALPTSRGERTGTYWIALRRGRKQYSFDCFTLLHRIRRQPC
jgi:hypothetical protein